MAEILIKAIDSTNKDPIKDKAGCYKVGDPVVVMPDGHKWSDTELSPMFYILKVSDLAVEDAKAKYLQPELGLPTGKKDENGFPILAPVLTRRLYKFDEMKAPQDAKLAVITQVQLDAAIVNKTTNQVISAEVIIE